MNKEVKLICRLRPSAVNKGNNKRNSEVRMNIFSSLLSNESKNYSQCEAPQTLVVSSKNAISQKIINDYLKNDSELIKNRQSIMENSDLFQFDQVFGERTPQQTFYDLVCSSKINDSLNGVSSTFLIIGGTESGKKYTLKGEDKGISILTVESLLFLFDAAKQKNKFKLLCSIYCANNTDLIDLVGNTRSQAIKSTTIRYLTDFKNLLRQSLFQYKNYVKEQNNKQTHIYISLNIQQDKTDIAQINFIIYNEFKKLNKESYEMQGQLRNLLTDLNNNPKQELENKGLEALFVAFSQSKFQNINIIFSISQLQTHFMEAYRTLQFAEELRQSIRPNVLTNRTNNKISSQQELQDNQSLKSRVSFGNIPEVGSKMSIDKIPFEQTRIDIPHIGSAGTINSKIYKADPAVSRLAELNYTKQFQELKELLKEKEVIEDHRLAKFERELKQVYEDNQRLLQKQALMEQHISDRDHLIDNLEKHIEDNRQQLELDQQMYLTAKQKENVYEQNQEELRDTVAQLNQQLRYTNEEIQMLRQRNRIYEQDIEGLKENELSNIKHYEKREDEFMKLIGQEQERNKQLYEELEYFSRELKEKEQNIGQLEDNIKTLNKVIEDQQKRLDDEKGRNKDFNDQMQLKGKKTDEVLKDLNTLENRYAKIKTKLETENIHLKEEKEKYLQKYKDKLKKYKTALKQEEQENSELKMSKLKLQTENDQLYNLSKQLETQIGKMNTEVPQMERLNTNYHNEMDRLKQHIHQLEDQLKGAEYEINQLQQQLQSAIAHLEQTNNEYEKLIKENQYIQRVADEKGNEVKQHEFMIDRMVEISEKQMDDLEAKFNKVTAQVNSLQHEKKSIYTEYNNQKIIMEQMEGNELIMEKKIVKLRKENKELTKQLKELNVNMRDMIVEKHQDLKNISMRQSGFSNAKMLSQNASYRSIRTNNLMMSGNKYDDDDYDQL